MAKAQILVVEDESIVAKDIQHRLSALGYHIPAVASSGATAPTFLDRASAWGMPLVLLLLVFPRPHEKHPQNTT